MEKRWYSFTDESHTTIRGDFATKQDASHDPQEELEESDPRVQEYLGPLWARATYQAFDIVSPEEFMRVVGRFNSSPRPMWRGQSNAAWPLETVIERDRDRTIIREVGLHTFEWRILLEAKRRTHHYVVDHPDPDDLLGWLAFLRNQGAPTRLLDVTWSPFVAAYFAVSHGFDDHDGAVWMISQFMLQQGLHTVLMQSEKPFHAPGTFGVLIDSYQPPTMEKRSQKERSFTQKDLIFGDQLLLLELALRGALAVEGVILVEPSQWIGRRQDVQRGAFLVPLNLRYSFQQNLENLIGAALTNDEGPSLKEFPKDDKAIMTVCMNAAVVKLRIAARSKKGFRLLLERMNLRASVLFPDYEGLVMELRNLVPPMGTWNH